MNMKKLKKILLYLLVFLATGTFLTVISLTLLDKYIYNLSAVSYGEVATAISSNSTTKVIKFALEEGATDVQYSFNNKFYTYLKDGKIYVNTVADGKNVNIIQDSKPIVYYNLLYDKNLILYFVKTPNNTSTATKLQLKTYEMSSKKTSEYNTFTVNNFSRVKDMNMSPLINILYINIETKNKNNVENNIIYRIDLFNSMSQVKSGLIADSMIMLQQKDRVYYEDTKSNIYVGSAQLNLFKEKVNMMGIDYDDNLYFLPKENKNKVYKVKNNRIIKTIPLNDNNVVKTYTNNEGVYLIYPTYVLNIAGDNPMLKIAKMSEYVQFEAIKGDKIYVRGSNNVIAQSSIVVEEVDSNVSE